MSGRIDFEGDAARSLYFEDGRIVGATSSAPAERVEELALRLGLVTREQHRLVASAAAPLATRRAAVTLLERGFLKPAELGALVRRRAEEVVFGVFGDAGARFRWSAAEVPADESTSLERTTLQLAVEGVRRRWLAPEVDAVLGGDATLLAPVATGPTPGGPRALARGAARARARGRPPDARRGRRARARSIRSTTRQVLAALVLVGTLAVRTFQGGKPGGGRLGRHRPRPGPGQARAGPPGGLLHRPRRRPALHPARGPGGVRAAPGGVRPAPLPRRCSEEGLEERLDEIQRVVADARDVLADDRLRGEYLRGLGE